MTPQRRARVGLAFPSDLYPSPTAVKVAYRFRNRDIRHREGDDGLDIRATSTCFSLESLSRRRSQEPRPFLDKIRN
jgi:hypothetical protein